jgi:oligosaccharide amylase
MRSISLGNGQMMVLMNERAQIKDFFFPYVGLENHMGGSFVHRVGAYADGRMIWFDDPSWDIEVSMAGETLVSDVIATNNELKIKIVFKDTIYNEKNILIRKIVVTNMDNSQREIKLFFGHEFLIYESHRGDTAYYDPIHDCLIHYKGRRVFLINAKINDKSFDQYSTGEFGTMGKEGTYKDAEDGKLAKNAVQHGKVDSVMGLTMNLNYKEEQTIYYWIAAATSIKGALDLDEYIHRKTPEHILQTTMDYWHAWVNKQGFEFCDIDPNIRTLFNKSLLMIRSHIDNNGSILASGDSDMLHHGYDTYSYMWPRDGALVASALVKAGYLNNAHRFFDFCNDVITEDGYLMHKYRPDGSLGSSWHAWTRDGKVTLPIQEDETALVLVALWRYYEVSKDLEFVENVYSSLIELAARFLINYTDEKTDLPQPSFDLWEEKYGVHTFTAATVYAALKAAAKFAEILGKTDSQHEFEHHAEKVQAAILKYLYNEDDGFVKMVNFRDGKAIYDRTLDISSVYAIYKFGVLPYDDDRVKHAVRLVEERLRVKTEVDGICRFENDMYFRVADGYVGNPWFICTLWLAQYYIEIAQNAEDLKIPHAWLEWTVRYAQKSGVLSEQLHPYTGEGLSATPLTWSHAEFVVTLLEYVKKMEDLGICVRK